MNSIIKLDHPAAGWDSGLPIGNGRLGAMVFGQTEDETLLINEETMFYGGPKNRHNPDSAQHIGKIRKLLWDKKVEDAEFLAMAAMTGSPCNLSPFQPAGHLRIMFRGHKGKLSSYLRSLDLDEAVASVNYELDGTHYKREYFASFSGNVIAYRVRGEIPITLMASLTRRPFEEGSGKIDTKTIAYWGCCGSGGVEYFGCARIIATGGKCSVVGSSLVAEDAKEIIIFVSFGTSYGGNTRFREQAIEALDESERKSFDTLKAEHSRIYKSLYDRVSLSINDVETPDGHTDELLEELRHGGKGDYLCVLGFNMGRYLLISSSYKCSLPPNLQGLWNGSYTPPWESAYTININLQMNYWPAEVCNLPECHYPLFDLLDKVMERGKETAQKLYGCRGFMACHNIDIWGDANPVSLSRSSTFWVMGGAWLALHLWEHYLFTLDAEFMLQRAFPVMEQALLFLHDYLVEDENGVMHTGPSVSPENIYITEDGQNAALSISPAMDIQITKELFMAYSQASRILGKGEQLRADMEAKVNRLPESKLTGDGRIREWLEDYSEKEPGHRHVSHLFALHPGTQITEKTPELMRAAEKTLAQRIENGGGHTGWSGAWAANFWARLKNGNRAGEHILGLLGGKTIENMLSVHPPFQIDGNFGLTAGVAEILLQSHAGCCELLPALPDIWRKGRVAGLRARGGITVNIEWADGKLVRASFLADRDTVVNVKYKDRIETTELRKNCESLFYLNSREKK